MSLFMYFFRVFGASKPFSTSSRWCFLILKEIEGLEDPTPLVFCHFLKILSIIEFVSSVHRIWGSDANVVLNVNHHS